MAFEEDEEDDIIYLLEKEGKLISSNPSLLHQANESLKTTAEQMINLFKNLQDSPSPQFITGLFVHFPSFITPELNPDIINQLWIDVINATQFISCHEDSIGLLESIRCLTTVSVEIHPDFLNYLCDTNVPIDPFRPYVLENLFKYFPATYLTLDEETQSNKKFFVHLLIPALSEGNITHRSYMIQLLFALHLTSDQINSIPELLPPFWSLVYDISQQSNLNLLIPIRKLKVLNYPFFENENPFIQKVLTDLHSNICVPSDDILEHALNLFKIFIFFPTPQIIEFLSLFIDIISNLSVQWINIKSISHSLDASLGIIQDIPSNQIKEIWKFVNSVPDIPSKYFVFVHFHTFFNEYYDFTNIFIQSLCQWKEKDNFDPVIFSFCACRFAEHFYNDQELFENAIRPSIEKFVTVKGNFLLAYLAIKSLKHFYRENLISGEAFIDYLFNIVLECEYTSYEHLFKFLIEIVDDEYDISDNSPLIQKLNEFVRSNIGRNELPFLLVSYLLDYLQFFVTENETEEFLTSSFTLCNNLIITHSYTEFPIILNHVTEFMYCICRQYHNQLSVYQPLYEFIINEYLLKYPFKTEYNENDEIERIQLISTVCYLCSRVCKIAIDCKMDWNFPLILVLNLLRTNQDDAIKTAMSILRRNIKMFYPVKPENAVIFNDIIIFIVDRIEQSNNISIVNYGYRLFSKFISHFPISELCSSLQNSIEEIKNSAFEQRLAVFHEQPLIYLDSKSFDFFEFVETLVLSQYVLTSMENLSLIRWIEYIPNNLLLQLLYAIDACVNEKTFAHNCDTFYPLLWRLLIEKMSEFTNKDIHKYRKEFVSMFEIIRDILIWEKTEKSHHDNQTLNVGPVFNFFSKLVFDDNIYYHENKDVDEDYALRETGPIVFDCYNLSGEIVMFNYKLMNAIGEAILEKKFNWNYPKMIINIIEIYQKSTTFHLFTDVGAEILFKFILKSFNSLESGENELATIGFSQEQQNELVPKMKEVLIDMKNRDPRFMAKLIENYPEEIVTKVF